MKKRTKLIIVGATDKLSAMGYTNINEFGGIIDWTGDIEK